VNLLNLIIRKKRITIMYIIIVMKWNINIYLFLYIYIEKKLNVNELIYTNKIYFYI